VEPEDVSPPFDPLLLESYKAANLSMKERSFAGLLKSDIFISAESMFACVSMGSADVKGEMPSAVCTTVSKFLSPEDTVDARHIRRILLKI
jgi:hypothetical protein